MRCFAIRILRYSGFAGNPAKALLIICLPLLVLFPPKQLFGQDEEPTRQPFLLSLLSNSRTEINPNYQYISSAGTHEARLHFARTIPMGVERSSLSLQSRISLVHGTLGVRTGQEMDQDLRWSAGLLKGDIYRAPFAVGITILKYDQIGHYDLEAQWLNLRLGPAVRWETGWGAVEPRLVGSIGAGSLRPGRTTFSELGPRADRTVHGFDTGYRVELPVRLNHWFLISISGGQRVLLGDRNVYVNQGRIEAQTVVLPKLQLHARYQLQRLSMRGRSEAAQNLRLGLRVWL